MSSSDKSQPQEIFASLFSPHQHNEAIAANYVDWSQLPEKFRHLIPYFERYGSLQFERTIARKLGTMTEEELVEVNNFYRLFLPFDDELTAWEYSQGISNSRAAALIYFTGYFLDF